MNNYINILLSDVSESCKNIYNWDLQATKCWLMFTLIKLYAPIPAGSEMFPPSYPSLVIWWVVLNGWDVGQCN